MADSSSPLGLLGTLRLLLNSFPPDAPPYCVIGALAVGAWGRPRATQDIDLLILLEESTQSEFTAWLGSAIRLRHRSHPVDLIIPGDAHEREALTRRVSLIIEGQPVWMATPEDLILLKLKACRDHDLVDARSIVHQQAARLDLNYLRNWADRLHLQNELRYVLSAPSAL
jgi:hypothetical protein